MTQSLVLGPRRDDPAAKLLLAHQGGSIFRLDMKLICTCHDDPMFTAWRWMAGGGLVAGIVFTLLACTGIVPPLFLAVSVVWLIAGVWALEQLLRRREEFGVVEIDGASKTLRHVQGARVVRHVPLVRVRGVSTRRASRNLLQLRDPADFVDAGDAAAPGTASRFDIAPRWILLHLGDRRRIRIGRASPWELGQILRALDNIGIPRIR